MAASSSDDGLAALRRVADVKLTANEGLGELYDLKGRLPTSAQVGCLSAIERRSGVHYALHTIALENLSPARRNALAAAIDAQRRIADAPADVGDELSCARLALVQEVLLSPTQVVLASERVPTTGTVCDSLVAIIERRGRLAESDARRVFTRLVLATKRAHDCGAVLRNIKPEAIQVRQQEKHGEFEVVLTQLHCAVRATRRTSRMRPLAPRFVAVLRRFHGRGTLLVAPDWPLPRSTASDTHEPPAARTSRRPLHARTRRPLLRARTRRARCSRACTCRPRCRPTSTPTPRCSRGCTARPSTVRPR
jgi:hypothetical protein